MALCPLLQPAKVEQVVDQPDEPLGGLTQPRHEVGHAGRIAHHGDLERLGQGLDRGDRRLELVGGVDHEVATQLLDATLLGAVGQDRQGLVAHRRDRHAHVAVTDLRIGLDVTAVAPGTGDRVDQGTRAQGLDDAHGGRPVVGQAEQLACSRVGRHQPALAVEEQCRAHQRIDQAEAPGALVLQPVALVVERPPHTVQRSPEVPPRGIATGDHDRATAIAARGGPLVDVVGQSVDPTAFAPLHRRHPQSPHERPGGDTHPRVDPAGDGAAHHATEHREADGGPAHLSEKR